MSAGPTVFLGPTLRRADALAIVPCARVQGPARQGDILFAVRECGATVIGLIDGAFLDVAAVWHREILWALDRGVRVLGAASMGALRAAELHRYGMHGSGLIFEAYRDGALPGWSEAFEDDDEVAVAHAPAELGHAALSDAMVDIRVTLARAEADGVVSRSQRDALAAQMKALHFPERRVGRLKAAAVAAGHAPLADWLERSHVSQKREDAVQLLLALAAGEYGPPAPAFEMRQALTWINFVAGTRYLSDKERAVIHAHAGDPASWQRLAREALGRMEILRTHPNAFDGKRALSAFREARGLGTRDALVAWASANDLDEAAVMRLALEEAAMDAAVQRAAGPPLQGAVVDLLRLAGRYGDPPGSGE